MSETMSLDDKLVKERFEREIEVMIPGYMAMIHWANVIGLKRLTWYAREAIIGVKDAHGIQILEKLADERDGVYLVAIPTNQSAVGLVR